MSKLRVDFFVQFVQFFFGKNKIANQELVCFFCDNKNTGPHYLPSGYGACQPWGNYEDIIWTGGLCLA
jgi:hypothetical protein